MKKKITFMIIALFCLASSILAQAVKKTETISEDEVPAAIRVAFLEDLGPIPEGGYWTVNFSVSNEGVKSVAKPTWYTYRKGNKQDKIEVRYSPEGKLAFAKGLIRINQNT